MICKNFTFFKLGFSEYNSFTLYTGTDRLNNYSPFEKYLENKIKTFTRRNSFVL